MARSFPNVKLVTYQISVAARRGYATTPSSNIFESMRGSGFVTMKKVSDESKNSSPWVPDPVTGYYKPEGQTNKLDAADLRKQLLKEKTLRN